MKSLPLAFLAVLLAGCSGRSADPDQANLERQFQESLSGATLVGQFTLRGKTGLSEEKYTIEKVSKLTGDTWLFHARIEYGSRDVTVPIPLTVKWAGDTPMVTLTDFSIPGVGTYTARVLFYRDQYAGTWSGGKNGGHLFGRITKPE